MDSLLSNGFQPQCITDFFVGSSLIGLSPKYEQFIADLYNLGDDTVSNHFTAAIESSVMSRWEEDMAEFEKRRPAFNEKMGPGTECLSLLDLKMLAGAVASSGYLIGVIDANDLDFLQNFGFSSFREKHYSNGAAGSVEEVISPAGNLFSDFFLDVSCLRGSSWLDMDIMLGGRVVEAMPNSVTTKKLRSIGRGYEIKSDDFPDFKDLVLDLDVKDKILRMVQLYQLQKSEKRASALRILLRGVPGSGKSMLSQSIAKLLGAKALIVNLSREQRSNPYLFITTFSERAKKNGMVLILEESEDFLSVNPFRGHSDNVAKVMFEDFEGVVIFTTNQTGGDRWFTPTEGIERRMDLIVDFEIPGAEHRGKILTQELDHWKKLGWEIELTDADIKASTQTLTLPGGFFPQVLKQAASQSLPEKKITKKNLLQSLKYVAEKSGTSKTNERSVESDIKLDQIVLNEKEKTLIRQAIKYSKENLEKENRNPILPQGSTILFSGPPGTGKTMTAQAIANELGLKIQITRASDILSMYVGGTEKNIKRIFEECERKKEILFIDEIEGLLHSREGASRSWEVTQVNEFLKALESFKGTMIGATNQMEMMDHAFGRRFLFHIMFTVPNPAERVLLWKQYLSGVEVDETVISRIAERYSISGGEIRNVAVKAHIREERDFAGLAKLCEEIERSRTGLTKKKIGIS
jgi:SpoVK/Ycf46/Vps4 family AAA+-type ATPase